MLDYRIRVCEPGDATELCALFQHVFGKPRSLEEWRWKFDSSRELGASSVPHSLVALTSEGDIVGHAGAVVLPGWFRGRSIPMVQGCDVMIHPEHRGGFGANNLFTLLLRELLDRIAAQLPSAFRYGFAGQGPCLVGERAGVYERMELALDIDVETGSSAWSPWQAVPLGWDDPRLDRLWARRRRQLSLAVVRDRAYLDWRYGRNPSYVYHLTGVAFLGQLIGWVVSRSDGNRLLLVDVLLPAFGLRAALQAAASNVVSDDASAAVVWLPAPLRDRLGSSARETPVMVTAMSRKSPIPTPEAHRMLYYTMGDVDIF
ncbi:GNAT family N-acetyltransferase [Thiorhodococcus fuscus]|uniref:GNAT family N-acetyltransferase n=1 Tax=Thiorhodococcus fuscus TaxID=527200 RepID=A0ABW4Y8X1_9GAMM